MAPEVERRLLACPCLPGLRSLRSVTTVSRLTKARSPSISLAMPGEVISVKAHSLALVHALGSTAASVGLKPASPTSTMVMRSSDDAWGEGLTADRGRKLGAVARSSPRLGIEQAAGERNTPDARRYNTDTPEPASCHGRKTSRQGPVRFLTDARISIEPQIMVAGKMHHGPLGERGDGEQRIDADRAQKSPIRRRHKGRNAWFLRSGRRIPGICG